MTNKLDFNRLIDGVIKLEELYRLDGELEKAEALRRWISELTALVQTLESIQKVENEATE